MRRRPVLASVTSLCLAASLLPFAVVAQTDRPAAFDIQLFQPSPSARSIFNVDLPQVASHLDVTASVWGSFVPTALTRVDGASRPGVVRNVLGLEAQFSLGLFEHLELGLAMPLVHQSVPQPASNGAGLDFTTLGDVTAAGDLRVYGKVPILRGATALALRLNVGLPTGDTAHWAGSASWTFAPAVVLAHTAGPVTIAANAGVRLHQRNAVGLFEVNDEVWLALAIRWALSHRVALQAELNAWITVDPSPGYVRQVPVEALAGAEFTLSRAVAATVGAGRGLTDGYGAPDIRVLGGLRVTVAHGTCTTGPEDYDGFQDGDYCNDPDNDRDGVPDALDQCPNDPEDQDGFLDDDGCPDPDNDGDGVLDADDRCPMDPEDHDRFQDDDGCPEPDNDRDGIPDLVDACPNEPEDMDNYQDEDGCPEPGPDAAVVTRTDTRLLLNQRIFFDFDSDTIRNVSFPILNEVANTIRRNPDISRLRVEGYTDGQGTTEYNTDLSFRRARAVVDYLVQRGVPRDHLDYQGYGQSHPVADDSAPEGQALNRRVEFTIVSQSGLSAVHTDVTAPAPAHTTAPATAHSPGVHPGHRHHR